MLALVVSATTKRQRVKFPCFLQVFGCQVRIPHGHRQALMPQNPLQCKDVAAGHHEVTRKSVPQYMGHLA